MELQPYILHFQFPNFESQMYWSTVASDDYTNDCHNNRWALDLYTGGNLEDEGNITFDIYVAELSSGDNDHASFYTSIIVRNALGGIVASTERSTQERRFNNRVNFPLTRARILDKTNNILVHGNLIVEVEVQYVRGDDFFSIPQNQVVTNMLKLLDSGDDSDVTFKVGDEFLKAHKCILTANAPHLSSICEGCKKEDPVSIRDTTPEIFRILLKYIYGAKAPEEEYTLKNGKAIIDAANRYGVSGLKMIAETTLCSNCVLDSSNVSDYILFADAKTCPLLKEYAISYFVARSNDILISNSLDKLKESVDLMHEIMTVMAQKLSSNRNSVDTDAVELMSVHQLRKKLDELGLDMDGSKDMLISRVKEAF